MNLITKIEENIYQIFSNETKDNFYIVINASPLINEKNEVFSQAIFLKTNDEKLQLDFSAPFSFLLNELKDNGTSPCKFLLDQLQIEVKNKLGLDLSGEFNTICDLRRSGRG